MKKKIYLGAIVLTILTIFSGCKKDPVPVADFSYIGANVFAPATVTFINNSSNASSYSWDFGDSYISSAQSPQHTYLAGGYYTVRLTATGNGGTNTTSKIIYIENAPTACQINSVTLTGMPAAGMYAVYFMITDNTVNQNILYDGSGSVLYNTTSSSLPLSWNLATPYVVSLGTTDWIEIWDAYTSTKIGEVSFNPVSLSDYYSSLTLTDQAHGVAVTLNLLWLQKKKK